MLELVKCESAGAWNSFVQISPQCNVFSTTPFLLALGINYDAWFLTDSGKCVLGALVIEPFRRDFEAPHDYSLYQGIFFAPSSSESHSETRNRLSLVEFLLNKLGGIYSSLSFCLHPTFDDLRAVQWFNYHAIDQGQFAIHLHYTGVINLEAYSKFSDYLQCIRKVRVQEYNKAIRNGFHVETSSDLAIFRDLYIKTFDRQGITLEETKVERAVSIAQAALSGSYGHLFLCRDSSGCPVSATVFLTDQKSSYYMFGASDPACRNTGASTFLVLESIRYFYDLGMKKIDMVGINSPNRGDFKTSFNAAPTPYFHVTWRRPVIVAAGLTQ